MKESAHRCALCISLDIETFLETINTTASIYQLLLAGIERMALGADHLPYWGWMFSFIAVSPLSRMQWR